MHYGNCVSESQAMLIRAGVVGFCPKITNPCTIKRPFLFGPRQTPSGQWISDGRPSGRRMLAAVDELERIAKISGN